VLRSVNLPRWSVILGPNSIHGYATAMNGLADQEDPGRSHSHSWRGTALVVASHLRT